jgi:hypothetical protein
MTNWEACITWLLTVQVPAWRDIQRQTVRQCIDELEQRRHGFKAQRAKQELALTALGLLLPGEVADRPAGYVLAVPNSTPPVAKLFEGTDWACAPSAGGLWKDALRQAPREIVITDHRVNRMSIGGVQLRCSLVVLKNFRGARER